VIGDWRLAIGLLAQSSQHHEFSKPPHLASEPTANG